MLKPYPDPNNKYQVNSRDIKVLRESAVKVKVVHQEPASEQRVLTGTHDPVYSHLTHLQWIAHISKTLSFKKQILKQ